MNRRSVFGWSSGLVASTLMLAACGSSSSTSAPAVSQAGGVSSAPGATTTTGGGAAVDGCSVITQQEASTILGKDPGAGKPQDSPPVKGCEYSAPGGASLTVIVVSPGSRAQYDAGKTGIQAHKSQSDAFQEVTGIGDAAFVVSSDHGASCTFLKGSAFVNVIWVSPPLVTSSADTMITLCRTAAGRL